MAKFRKKPVEVFAEQYHEGSDLNSICHGGESCEMPAIRDLPNCKPHVHTAHQGQGVILEEGDWILPEPDGVHFYPCKPDIFEAMYGRVECLTKETAT